MTNIKIEKSLKLLLENVDSRKYCIVDKLNYNEKGTFTLLFICKCFGSYTSWTDHMSFSK